jgi:hypothetical protein
VKRFACECGQRVFFEDYTCLACRRELGFAPGLMAFLSRVPDAPDFRDSGGGSWAACSNRSALRVCNWLIPATDPQLLCQACRMNRVIPNLQPLRNQELWVRMEEAKRRLVYSLLTLGLPYDGSDGRPPLGFEFMEDRRSNPQVAESFVTTGHRTGIITINLLEADDVSRHAVREEMSERYRTLLGHFRHESGHYFSDCLLPPGEALDEFRRLFGDERADYADAIRRYYDAGPTPDWPTRFVSAYASAHPLEDWAECWAHYLHITDGLETARANGLLPTDTSGDWDREVAAWIEGSVKLNEITRSLGVDDAYPFVLNAPVRQKLAFIRRRLEAARRRPPAGAAAGVR